MRRDDPGHPNNAVRAALHEDSLKPNKSPAPVLLVQGSLGWVSISYKDIARTFILEVDVVDIPLSQA